MSAEATTTVSPSGTGSPQEPRLRDGIRFATLVFLAARFGFSLLSVVGTGLIQPRAPVPLSDWPLSPAVPGWHNLWEAAFREDALHFLKIAVIGYRPHDASVAFFPLYPLAIRVVAWLPWIGARGASLIVSNAAFWGALAVLHALTRRELGDSVARRTLVLLAVFPTAFFFLAPYSESLFLLLTLLSFWWARRDRWFPAGLAGALAALTRSIGIVLLPALAVEAVWQWRADRGRLWARLAGAASVALGPAAFFAYSALRFHDLLAPLHAQRYWQRELSAPWMTVLRSLHQAWSTVAQPQGGYWLTDALVVGVVVVACLVGVRILRATYLVYAFGSLLVPLMYPYPGRQLVSVTRFVVVIFPAFWVIAKGLDRRPGLEPFAIAISAALYALFAVLFVNWWYIF